MNVLTTPLRATLGIDLPIAQAPIGSATTPRSPGPCARRAGWGRWR